MFGHHLARYYEAKSDKSPEVEVTEEEFVALVMETGLSEQDARMQAFVAKNLGGKTKIGDKKVGIKQEPKPKKPRKTVKAGEATDYQVEQESTNHARICLGGKWMTFIVASQQIRQEKGLGVTEAMDYVDNLPWLEK